MRPSTTVHIDGTIDLHIEGWAGQWDSRPGERYAAWSGFRPDGLPAVVTGDCANSVEPSVSVALEVATHWPRLVVADGNHEYDDIAQGVPLAYGGFPGEGRPAGLPAYPAIRIALPTG